MASSEQMRSLFDSMDASNTGYITHDDILTTIAEMGLGFTDDEAIRKYCVLHNYYACGIARGTPYTRTAPSSALSQLHPPLTRVAPLPHLSPPPSTPHRPPS